MSNTDHHHHPLKTALLRPLAAKPPRPLTQSQVRISTGNQQWTSRQRITACVYIYIYTYIYIYIWICLHMCYAYVLHTHMYYIHICITYTYVLHTHIMVYTQIYIYICNLKHVLHVSIWPATLAFGWYSTIPFLGGKPLWMFMAFALDWINLILILRVFAVLLVLLLVVLLLLLLPVDLVFLLLLSSLLLLLLLLLRLCKCAILMAGILTYPSLTQHIPAWTQNEGFRR